LFDCVYILFTGKISCVDANIMYLTGQMVSRKKGR
jgi:hypothetical protein